jgi:hypothetical protein
VATFPRVDGTKLANALALVALSLAASGCFTKVMRSPVYDENGVSVFLRYETKGGKPVEKGYSHPAVIAPVRLTNLLSRIEVRKDEKPDRSPAIETDLLYPLGEGISRALAKADSTQQVVVMAKQRKRSLGIFTQDYLTSMVIWNKDDKLFIKLGHLDWAMPKDPKEVVAEPKDSDIIGKFRTVPSDGIAAEGTQLVTANWRDPIFKDSGALSIRPGGQVVRRTVLMDSGEEPGVPPEPAGGAAPPPEGVSPAGLRALADLEESRRRGELTEADYQAKRRAILSGSMPAAPTPTSNPAPAPQAPASTKP